MLSLPLLLRQSPPLLLLLLLLRLDAALGQGGGFHFPGSSPAGATEEEDKGPEITRSSSLTEEDSNNKCVVSSSDGPSAPCVFPFVFGGFEFNGCVTTSDPEGRLWCSTRVDSDRVHVGGGGHWGHCPEEGCPVSDDPHANDDPTEGLEEEEDATRVQEGALEFYKECTTSDGKTGQCKPPSLCIGLTDQEEDANECELREGGAGEAGSEPALGTCCSDLTEESQGSAADTLAAGEEEKRREEEERGEEAEVDNVSLGDVDSLLGERFGFVEEEEEDDDDDRPFFPDQLEEEEEVPPLAAAAPTPEEAGEEEDEDGGEVDAATAFHLRFNAPSEEALATSSVASELLSAASDLQSEKDLDQAQAGIGLRMFNADSSRSIKELCPWIPGPSCGRKDLFRRSDGSCNNMKNPNFGRAATPYQRILLPEYTDGSIDLPRRAKARKGRRRGSSSSSASADLPSAREVSTSALVRDSNSVDSLHTVLVMQMGQFVDHDITHTPNHGVGCCDRGGVFPSKFDKEKCFPIRVPSGDPFWTGRRRKTCMSFARSLPSPGLKCGLQFRQQMNQITHWLDSSNVYGSSDSMTKRLRRGSGGQLKITRQAGSKAGALPSCAEQRSAGMCRGCSSCFLAGDVRANEQLNLIVMHTVWMREHNRVARGLSKLNPGWSDERLFQEARRITNAEYQHIVYKEWLPLVLGKSFMTSFGLWPLSKGYSKEYRDDFDPRITNEFATAAFRFGHSLIPKHFNRIRRTRSGNGFTSKMSMREVFFKPNELRKQASMLDDLVRGLSSQEGESWDNAFVPDVTDHLFEGGRGQGGLDLVALNVQRGRDHGLPGYNAYRQVCHSGSGRASKFSDFEDLIPPDAVEELSLVYDHVDDVDLFVGGFLERAQGDSLIGPTFKCIVGDQFARLKLGDRFFYDLGLDPNTRFSEQQLREIRKTSMARILCDNTDTVTRIQPQAFKLPGSSRSNRVQSCRSVNIPSVNLAPFRERRRSGSAAAGKR